MAEELAHETAQDFLKLENLEEKKSGNENGTALILKAQFFSLGYRGEELVNIVDFTLQ